MKRRIITVLVALCLVLCAVPMMIFAGEDTDSNTTKVTSVSFQLNGYEADKSMGDITVDVTSSAEALYDYHPEYYRSIVFSTAGDTMDDFIYGILDSNNDIALDTDYYLGIMLRPADGYDLSSLKTDDVTVKVGDQTLKAESIEHYIVGYLVIFRLPQLKDTVTYEIPIKKTVTLGGNTAPGKTTFEFELIDEYGEEYTAEELAKEGISYTASVTINGSGKFTGKLALTGKEANVKAFLEKGFLIHETKLNDSNWTTDDSYWVIANEGGQTLAGKLKTVDFEKQIFDVDYDTVAAGPSFESVYTNNENDVSPKTGDESGLRFWVSIVFVSGLALAGTMVARQRNLNR